MDAVNEDVYVDMSLDEVIRDMKARKAAQERGGLEDNSPLYRQYPNFQVGKRPFRTQFQPKSFINNRSNYINHMAKKRVQQARRTLDLRQKLITIRANKEGLDLRWKLVANMIFKLRQQAKNAPPRPRYHPYYVSNPHGPSSELASMPNGTISHPRVTRSTLSQIERLVGKLPPWMKPTNLAPTAPVLPRGPPIHYEQSQMSGVGPIRTNQVPHYSPNVNVGVPMCQHPCAAQTQTRVQCHMPPAQTRCPPTMGNRYFASQPHPNGMPQLLYDPVPPVSTIPKHPGSTGDQIEIIIADEGSEIPRVKKTLNERFTHQ